MSNQYQPHSFGGKQLFSLMIVVILAIAVICLGIAIHHHDEHPFISSQLPGQTWRVETYVDGSPKGHAYDLSVKTANQASITEGGRTISNVPIKCRKHGLTYPLGNRNLNMTLIKQTRTADTFKPEGVTYHGRLVHVPKAVRNFNQKAQIKLSAE